MELPEPCPFCKVPPEMHRTRHNDEVSSYVHAIVCCNDECEVEPSTKWQETAEIAIAEWNKCKGE